MTGTRPKTSATVYEQVYFWAHTIMLFVAYDQLGGVDVLADASRPHQKLLGEVRVVLVAASRS